VSYNALIQNNTFLDNAWGSGAGNPGFPAGAIYISESGGDSRVPNTAGISTITISNNTFTDNWDGVILWENSNRFCSNGLPTTQCTLVNPSVATPTSCASALANTAENKPTDSPDYYDLCRWKTQNVSVSNNVFNLTPANIGADCTTANHCGLNGLFSVYGSTAPYTSSIVPTNITFNQNNVFSDNTYNGPWAFMAWSQGNIDYPVAWAQWTATVTDKCSTAGEISSGTCDSGFGQDAGSTYNGSLINATPSTPNGVTATANSATSVTVSWSASSDSGGPGIGGYYILRDGVKIASVGATTTYTDTSASANTQYSYTIEAYDIATPPDVSAASGAAVVTTPSSGSNPTVSITSPTSNALVYGGNVGVSATATANGTVVQTLTAAPYNFTFSTLGYTDGSFTVAVKATDNQGNSSTSSRTVYVTNGDLGGNGCVGLSDLIILAKNYGKSGTFSYAQGNITGATTAPEVGLSDLIILAKSYGFNDGLGTCTN
jgi:hypothetical protein